MAFKPVSPQVNFIQLETEILFWWYSQGVIEKYLHKNDKSKKKFTFLDGPITANNPMGVHHGWGRTYKDLWQKYKNLKGFKERFQNGFDCQGLWVEVEVEKELGFKSKKDIEAYGVDKFVEKCKERVRKYSSIQTEQSKRLGYFMDWNNSYFTMSDENNYAIWKFIKTCWERGWVYKGHDSVPWCPRCETAISQHEILTEDYKEVTHKSVYLKLPLVDKKDEYLLVWTTTPWTIPANIAVAVDEKLEYALVDNLWIAKDAIERIFGPNARISKKVLGKELIGLKYTGPYDDLEAVQKVASHPLFHAVVATDSQILPINSLEGTGLVHTAVSAGEEDFKLGKKLGLPLIPVIADNADYLQHLGDLTGKNAKKHPEIITEFLEENNWTWKVEPITHRYPGCWRCKTELVWKIADEWYIAMDKEDPTDDKHRTLRGQMIDVAKQIRWLPEFGLDRELDWLKNMHDWLISKKNRYWGLALPIYECKKCNKFQVVGSKDELKEKSDSGWEKFEGHSPHRPWIDEVTIKCDSCGETVARIADVGNPWLDAGIVPFSTLPQDWFPADFITESFPGQFKNWFYALIAMSTVMAKTNPFKTVLGYASLLAEDGRPMHKSWGNSIEFNEGAEKIGVDVMRWMYASQSPANNLLFGYKIADETRRRFHLMFWNSYNFFITYAIIDNFNPSVSAPAPSVLDQWILSRLDETISQISSSLEIYDAYAAVKSLESFVSDLSLWHIRRSRDRIGPSVADSDDKLSCYHTLYKVFKTISIVLSPFMPFIPEAIYQNLVLGENQFTDSSTSIHLESWPQARTLDESDQKLIIQMRISREIVEKALAERKSANIKVRQPLAILTYTSPERLPVDIEQLVADEVNVKHINWKKSPDVATVLNLALNPQLEAEGKARELIRNLQDLRKKAGLSLTQRVLATAPNWPHEFEDYIKSKALLSSLKKGPELKILP